MFDSTLLIDTLNSLCEKKNLAGVSACAMGPYGPLFTFNHGFIDAAGTIAPTCDTMFGIASMSKSITSLCACILACEGKLDLDTPVSDFLPNFRVPGQPKESVTVRHLAMHTAAIPPMEPLEWSIAMNSPARREDDWLREMRRTAPNPMETIDQVMDYIANCGYEFPVSAGEAMSYSNEGYAVLSYVVDKAAGMPLEQFMHERIFAPLGMTRTVLDNGIAQARALSGGNITSLFEMADGERVCDDAWSVLPPFRGCAMVKSTARDMAVYYRMIASMGVHEGIQVIPAHACDLLVGRYHPLSSRSTMCMGLNKREFAGHVICDHGGALHGVSTKGALLLGEGIGFSVLCNQGDEDMDELMYAMLNAVIGLPLQTSQEWFVPVPYSFSEPHMLGGRYTGHEGVPSILSIHIDENTEALRGTRDNVSLTLRYCGGTRFLALDANDENRVVCRLEFMVRSGHAWGVRCGTRIFTRL